MNEASFPLPTKRKYKKKEVNKEESGMKLQGRQDCGTYQIVKYKLQKPTRRKRSTNKLAKPFIVKNFVPFQKTPANVQNPSKQSKHLVVEIEKKQEYQASVNGKGAEIQQHQAHQFQHYKEKTVHNENKFQMFQHVIQLNYTLPKPHQEFIFHNETRSFFGSNMGQVTKARRGQEKKY